MMFNFTSKCQKSGILINVLLVNHLVLKFIVQNIHIIHTVGLTQLTKSGFH